MSRVIKKFKGSSTAGTFTCPEPCYLQNESGAQISINATPADAFYTSFNTAQDIVGGLVGSPEVAPTTAQNGLAVTADTGVGSGATANVTFSGSDIGAITIDSKGADYRAGDRVTLQVRSGRLEVGTDLLARVGDTTPVGADENVPVTEATMTQSTTGATAKIKYRISTVSSEFTITTLEVVELGTGFQNNVACTVAMKNSTGTFDVTVTPLFADMSYTTVKVGLSEAMLANTVACKLESGQSTGYKVKSFTVTGSTSRSFTGWTDF